MTIQRTKLESESALSVDLSYAVIPNTDLSFANLTSANFEGANLTGSNFSMAQLRSANLSNAILKEVNLEGADLQSASLVSADLTSANLRRASFSCANLKNASLRNADMRGADFGDSIGVRWFDLFQGRINEETLHPSELTDAEFFEFLGASYPKIDWEEVGEGNKGQILHELNKIADNLGKSSIQDVLFGLRVADLYKSAKDDSKQD